MVAGTGFIFGRMMKEGGILVEGTPLLKCSLRHLLPMAVKSKEVFTVTQAEANDINRLGWEGSSDSPHATNF